MLHSQLRNPKTHFNRMQLAFLIVSTRNSQLQPQLYYIHVVFYPFSKRKISIYDFWALILVIDNFCCAKLGPHFATVKMYHTQAHHKLQPKWVTYAHCNLQPHISTCGGAAAHRKSFFDIYSQIVYLNESTSWKSIVN